MAIHLNVFFIRAFKHRFEDKTDNAKDKLYFLEQYTSGRPKELIQSCLYMDPKKLFFEA